MGAVFIFYARPAKRNAPVRTTRVLNHNFQQHRKSRHPNPRRHSPRDDGSICGQNTHNPSNQPTARSAPKRQSRPDEFHPQKPTITEQFQHPKTRLPPVYPIPSSPLSIKVGACLSRDSVNPFPAGITTLSLQTFPLKLPIQTNRPRVIKTRPQTPPSHIPPHPRPSAVKKSNPIFNSHSRKLAATSSQKIHPV